MFLQQSLVELDLDIVKLEKIKYAAFELIFFFILLTINFTANIFQQILDYHQQKREHLEGSF